MRTRRVTPLARVAGMVALLVALAGCTAPRDDAPPDVPPTAVGQGPGPDRTAVVVHEQVLAERLTPEGTVPLDLALDLFAGTFGPIDGGDPEAVGPVPGSATSVVRGVLAHWAALTPAQRAAVEELLGPVTAGGVGPTEQAAPHDATAGAEVRTVGTGTGTGTGAALPELEPLVAEVRAELERRFGRELGVRVQVLERTGVGGRPAGRSDSQAFAVALSGGGVIASGRMDVCRIVILPWAVTDAHGLVDYVRALLAHELTHCFQFASTDVEATYAGPEWVIEGGAEFAGSVFHEPWLGLHWESWLTDPGRSLFARQYSAAGAFVTAEQSGADAWEAVLPMVASPSIASALGLLFATSPEEAMRTVAQALVREPPLGPAWDTDGPGITDDRATDEWGVVEGAPAVHELTLRRYATAPFTVDMAGQVMDVSVQGMQGRLGAPGGRTFDLHVGFSERFCVTGSCTCPDGTDVGGVEIPREGIFGLGLTTLSPADGAFRFTVLSLEDACASLPASQVLVFRFDAPADFEVHGGHCLVQTSGDLLIQAGDGRYPEGRTPPPEHRDDVAVSIYKNPAGPPEGGTVQISVGGVDRGGGSRVRLLEGGLAGTFSTDTGYAGEWRCARLVTAAELGGG